MDALAAAATAKIQARPKLASVTVGIGAPPRLPKKTTAWIMLEVPDWHQEWETSGPPADATVKEDFTLTILLAAHIAGDDPIPARDTVVSMMQGISDALREDPSLGGDVFQASIASGVLGAGVIDNARIVAAEIGIAVTADLA